MHEITNTFFKYIAYIDKKLSDEMRSCFYVFGNPCEDFAELTRDMIESRLYAKYYQEYGNLHAKVYSGSEESYKRQADLDEHKVIAIVIKLMITSEVFKFDGVSYMKKHSKSNNLIIEIARPNSFFTYYLLIHLLNYLVSALRGKKWEVQLPEEYEEHLFFLLHSYSDGKIVPIFSLSHIIYLLQKYTDDIGVISEQGNFR